MPQFKLSDIPDLSDKELEELLNTTIVELLPDNPRIYNQLYNRGVCIIADLLKTEQDRLRYVNTLSLKIIGDRIQEVIRTICNKAD